MGSCNLYVDFLIVMKPKNINNFKRLYYKTVRAASHDAALT